jgi:hypothetical protein
MNLEMRKNKNIKVKPVETNNFQLDYKRKKSNHSKTSSAHPKKHFIKINKSFKDEEKTEDASPRSNNYQTKSSFGSDLW